MRYVVDNRGAALDPADGQVTSASEPPVEGDAASPRRRLLLRGGLGLAFSLGLVGLGAFLGFEGFNRWAVPAAPEVTIQVEPLTPGTAVDVPSTPMPDVLALPQEVALATIADAGFDPSTVLVEERASAGEPGTVIEQQPTHGTRDPDELVLTIAVATEMPDLVGMDRTEAEERLIEIGATATFIEVAAPGRPVGTVVSTRPAAGETTSSESRVEIVARPSAIYLDALDPLDSDCRADAADVAGTSYDRSLACELRSNRATVTADYQLNGDIERFEATFGQSDRTDLDARVGVEISLDGEVARSLEFTFGEATATSLELDGALRLSITATLLDEPDIRRVDLVIADARLLGPEPAIDRLVGP